MEEKLYFKPENYGKKKESKEKPASEKKDRKGLKLAIFFLFLLVIILIILWLLRGKTTVSGRYPENVKNESLTCVATNLIPPKINSIDSSDKEIKISAIFKETTELKTISFIYTLQYASGDEAYIAEAKSHAWFNKALAASSYDVDKFSNKFARYDNKLIISLFANKNELDQIAAPYFMLGVDKDGNIPQSVEEFEDGYTAQGFKCESSLDD